MRAHALFVIMSAAAFLGASAVLAREKLETQRPFIAIWREHERMVGSKAPYLRIAIWEDGRILFAANPEKWSHDLHEGKILPDQIAELKKKLGATGVFDLNNATYLVPDAPVDCVMADFDGKTQILRWDERETPNYGINITPKPRHVKFKACWKAINQLALAVRPVDSGKFEGTFQPAKSWSLRPAIQSR